MEDFMVKILVTLAVIFSISILLKGIYTLFF